MSEAKKSGASERNKSVAAIMASVGAETVSAQAQREAFALVSAASGLRVLHLVKGPPHNYAHRLHRLAIACGMPVMLRFKEGVYTLHFLLHRGELIISQPRTS